MQMAMIYGVGRRGIKCFNCYKKYQGAFLEIILRFLHFITASFSQILSALIAVLFWFFIYGIITQSEMLSEMLTEPKSLTVILSLPFAALAFTAYAIGGQKLLRKVAPKWAEKESDEAS